MNNIAPIEIYKLTALSDYVECLNHYSFDQDAETQEHTILPEGYLEIIIQFGKNIAYKSLDDTTWRELPRAFIGGLHNKSFKIQTYPSSEFLSICFKAGRAKYIIPDRLTLYKNRSVSVANIFGDFYSRVIRSMSVNPGVLQIQPIEDFLSNNFNEERFSKIEDSVDYALRRKGIVGIDVLAERANLSVSQFRNRFCQEVGISPKAFCKIARINNLIRDYARAQQQITLTELSHRYEYFDQSHFIHDFRSLTSVSPKTFFSYFNN